jgi:hypothetical protein
VSGTVPSPRRAQFVLAAPPPVRALAIAAGLAVVGALLLVLWGVFDWPVGLAVLAVVLLVLGVALGASAVVLTAGVRTTDETDDQQITVARHGRSGAARWVDVYEVRVVGHRLTLRDKDGAGLVTVLNPRARANPVFLALMAEVQQRLDADRGYSPRP